jgi:hypothetical protein
MPVISSRRYSSYLTTPSITSTSSSSSSTSGLGSYRSSNYSSSSTSTLPLSTSRFSNYGGDSYRSTTSSSSYRSSLNSSSTLGNSDKSGTSTYRSRYDFDENNNNKRSDSLSTRIGVSSKNDSRSSRIFDTLPPLPSSSSYTQSSSSSSYLSKRAPSRSRDIGTIDNSNSESNGSGKVSLMDDLEFYEKYSPSRYLTKFEAARSRSLSEATSTTTPSSRDSSPPPTPKSEVKIYCDNASFVVLSLSLPQSTWFLFYF